MCSPAISRKVRVATGSPQSVEVSVLQLEFVGTQGPRPSPICQGGKPKLPRLELNASFSQTDALADFVFFTQWRQWCQHSFFSLRSDLEIF